MQNENDDDDNNDEYLDKEANQEDSNTNKEDYKETDNYTSFDNNDDDDDRNDGDDEDDGDSDDDGDDGKTNNFEDYSSPSYDFPDNFNENLQNIDDDWIIIFILRFQTRFRLSDTAIDTLIKFVKHVLTELDCNRFKNFPTSLHTARKKLRLKHQFVTFSVCPSCHKLHNMKDVKQHTIQQQKAIKKCDHVQFPNHHSLRQCDTPLSE